ncbi:MAG: GAF domain-containing sensor histidine kinase [Phycisphaerae bacterium]|nr:GAF domain-containing sensor histidine kinase [Phycisphaerae bacterium]
MPENKSYSDALAISEEFFELYDRMIGSVDIPTVLQEVADVVCKDINSQRASVYLVKKDTNELEAVAVTGKVAKIIRIPIAKTSLAGFCAATGQSFVIPDAYGDLSVIDPQLRFDHTWDKINDFRTKDVMCAPAVFKGELLGVVQGINSKGEPFGGHDLESLKSVSRLVGYSLYHARLYNDLATMKELEKQKAEFVRVMVHELKSPISGARMLISALEQIQGEDSQAAGMTRKVGARMDHMLDLITDMLEFAKVKSGEPMGEITVVDVTECTKKICTRYVSDAEQKNLGIDTAFPDSPLGVRIDTRGYEMVVSNLLSNAIKYTTEGAVKFSLSQQDSMIKLAVTDTGIGIPEKDIPKLFKEFYRASNAKSQQIPGSGVGLSGVKSIVERFGGRLELESKENVGSTFYVYLPISEIGGGGEAATGVGVFESDKSQTTDKSFTK